MLAPFGRRLAGAGKHCLRLRADRALINSCENFHVTLIWTIRCIVVAMRDTVSCKCRGSLERLIQGERVLVEIKIQGGRTVKPQADGQDCACLRAYFHGLRPTMIQEYLGFLQMHGYLISCSQTGQTLQ